MVIVKRSISETICGILTCETTTDFFDAIGQKFKESSKAKIMNFLNSFSGTRYDNTGGVEKHILKELLSYQIDGSEYPITDGFFVHQVINFLQIENEQLKISYIVLRGNLSIGELIYICVQEEKNES